uniref:Glutaredoxin domain-containing protein n=1 Tax=Caenorhabditis tropicalis TaxID=1561998 RepID=A0A1I7TPC6_9PELO
MPSASHILWQNVVQLGYCGRSGCHQENKKMFSAPKMQSVKSLFKSIGVENNKYFFANLQNHGVKERCQQARSQLPVAVYEVTEKSQRTEQQIKFILNTHSLCVLKNFGTVYAIDYDTFRAEALTELFPDMEVSIRRQLPQSTKDTSSYGCKQKKNTWLLSTHEQTMPLKQFMEHRKHIKEIASETYEKILKDGKKAEDHLKELEKKLEDCTLEGPFQGRQNNFCKPVTYLQPFVFKNFAW